MTDVTTALCSIQAERRSARYNLIRDLVAKADQSGPAGPTSGPAETAGSAAGE